MIRLAMRFQPLPALLFSALLSVAAPAAHAEGVGVTLGPTVGGGGLVGGVVQIQLSRPVFLEADLAYRGGWDVGTAYYPNLMVAGGVVAQFGERPLRNGFFAKVATTAPAASYEAWVAFGWSMRAWGPKDIRSFTMDLGPAVYLAREMPSGVDLGEIPFFAHLRFAWHFPVVTRAGNESVRPPPREKKKKKKGADAAEPSTPEQPAAPTTEPPPADPPVQAPGSR